MMSLPFLPLDQLRVTFMSEFGSLSDDRLVRLRDYLLKNWFNSKVFPPETWIVYMKHTRTNNDCEGWHRRLNHAARDSTPSLYELVPLLHEEAAKLPLQQLMVAEGTMERLQRKSVRERENEFYLLWNSFEAGDISAVDLLKAVSDLVGPVQY